jgi:7-carboxy-7-deazaguanine synthase
VSTDRTLRLSEIFESVQGEGASAGVPSAFLRLATCNLRCRWCDTSYTWDWSRYRYEDEVREVPVAEVARELAAFSAGQLVITGGEPLLQQRALVALLGELPRALRVEVETNGTLVPPPALTARVDQWNVSPKLASSGELRPRCIVPDALAAFVATGRAWLKLVVQADEELAEIDTLLAEIAWPKDRILFMPEATTRLALAERAPVVLRLAQSRGVGTSPRLHVERWDGKRGV